jgi:hypothetical protein
MIAEYETQLPDKKLLQAKLHEFYQMLAPQESDDAESETSPRRRKLEQQRGKDGSILPPGS